MDMNNNIVLENSTEYILWYYR